MSIADFFGNLFKTKKRRSNDNPESPLTANSLERIKYAMGRLVQKAATLNDSWQEQKTALVQIQQITDTFVLSNEIASAKMEQDILGKITAVSSSCDRVIAGNKDVDFAAQVQALQTVVNQRKAF